MVDILFHRSPPRLRCLDIAVEDAAQGHSTEQQVPRAIGERSGVLITWVDGGWWERWRPSDSPNLAMENHHFLAMKLMMTDDCYIVFVWPYVVLPKIGDSPMINAVWW